MPAAAARSIFQVGSPKAARAADFGRPTVDQRGPQIGYGRPFDKPALHAYRHAKQFSLMLLLPPSPTTLVNRAAMRQNAVGTASRSNRVSCSVILKPAPLSVRRDYPFFGCVATGNGDIGRIEDNQRLPGGIDGDNFEL